MNPDQLTNQLTLFLDVLECGSFSAAARRHPLTPSAVARRIDSLEKSLGSSLFLRSTHAIRVTPAGLAFAQRAQRILSELHQARAEAVSLSSVPEGQIRIDAPAPFGRRRLAPVIAEFLQLYPGLDVQLRLIDSFVDLRGDHLGEVDLVLRIGPVADTRLIATPLAPLIRVVCASPAYLERRGIPSHPSELLEHDGLDWDGLTPQYAWRFMVDEQLQQFRPRRQRMSTNNAETLVYGALAGLGIAHLPTWLVSEHLLRGELVPVLCPDGLPAPEPSSIYALNLNRETHSRTRLLLGFMRERFGELPPWDQALRARLQPAGATSNTHQTEE
ncbi:LysR family transcriptional regulator [Pseudomonas sp. B392_1p]|uniref:LysR family transcriptional regulator n=1 Tax=Pseudomonas sp. B392_1p TaxID=3457507 RepID=UPI003FD6AEE0